MGFFNRFFGRGEGRFSADSLDLFRQIYGAPEVKSGTRVNYATSMEVTAVLGCSRVICEAVSTVPLKIFRMVGNVRSEATDHPLYELFAGCPNSWQNSVEFRDQIALHLALLRNAFVFINRSVTGKILELIPFEPQHVITTRNNDWSLTYTVTPPNGGAQQKFSQDQIWHIRAHPNWSGWYATEAVRLAREAIGLGLATEEAHARLHKNGANVSGLYSVSGTLTEEQHKKLTAWLESYVSGLQNKSKPLVSDRDAKFTPMQMNGVDSQHLETRRFQIEEICRALGVLPIMVGHYDKNSTYASAEQMFLAHNIYTARPWHRRLEKAVDTSLLTMEERTTGGLYSKFIDTELLRGAAAARAAYYQSGINAGWLTRNEARNFEDLNPIDGLDIPIVPLAMGDGTDMDKPPPVAVDPPKPPTETPPPSPGE